MKKGLLLLSGPSGGQPGLSPPQEGTAGLVRSLLAALAVCSMPPLGDLGPHCAGPANLSVGKKGPRTFADSPLQDKGDGPLPGNRGWVSATLPLDQPSMGLLPGNRK